MSEQRIVLSLAEAERLRAIEKAARAFYNSNRYLAEKDGLLYCVACGGKERPGALDHIPGCTIGRLGVALLRPVGGTP